VKHISRRFKAFAAIYTVAILSACSGSGSVNLGSGQAADPGTVDFPVAYVKRTIPIEQDDVRAVRDTTPDADLFVRDRASPAAIERNVTERVTGTNRFDIKDVDVSIDGKKFIFAMRGPLDVNQDEEEAPSWGIWEYDIAADVLHRVIISDTIASEGNDIGPHYLPDGRIVFSSTRQRQSQAILRDEGKPGFEAQTDDGSESAFVLHVMKADGTDIHQISFNQSHDLSPTVLADGRLMWSRWEGDSARGVHLYTANPDGTNLQLLYGARSHQTGSSNGTTNSTIQFTNAREMQSGRILALVRPFTDTDFGGDLVMIDTRTYVENAQPLAANAGMTGPAQSRATPNDVTTIPGPSPGGRFNSGFPLWDGTNRILVSWSQCRLLEATLIVPCTATRLAAATAVTAAPLYSAWMFDPADNTLKPLFEPVEGVMITDLVAAQPRAPQAVILDRVPVLDFNPDLLTEGVGVLDIRSVYDFDGIDRAAPDAPNIATLANPGQRTAAQRRARFLRIEKVVSQGDDDLGFPDIDNAAFGTVNYMREILGYVPIEPDGSVVARIPANVAFHISVLDENGRRLFPVHRNWLQLRPGETRKCNGCHLPAAGATPDTSHGRDGTSNAVWVGASTTGTPFPGTQARFSPNAGETMAQTRARWSCTNENCRSQLLSVNVVFIDEWTEPTTAGRAADAPFSYTYTGAAGLTTAPPTSAGCTSLWNSTCRIVINYVRHIHPLWSVDRLLNTCTNCHSPVDAANVVRVPAGQLDLTDVDSQDQPLHKQAYRELLFSDNQQEVNMGVLQDTIVTTIDPVTGAVVTNTITVAPSLSAANARGSTRFFSRFVAGGSHAGYLTPAELRLLSEWVDIGAQYFNNPFDPAVPLN
jgi:Hydrazine synthase alpha subunit middle domain/WD40-like Beta Propeller Repeat